MSGLSFLFVPAVLIFVTALVIAFAVYLRRARKLTHRNDVDALLARLIAVDRNKLELLAVSRTPEAPDTGPRQVWDLTSMEAMAANCEVLIDLACYVQRWYPEALPVTEQLRLNAREIQWHLERLRGAEQHGHRTSTYPEYAQRAAAIYFRMTSHVLDLYEAAGMAALPQLRAAL